jgi:hypothetical protein
MRQLPTRADLDDLYEREANVHKKVPGRTQAKELPEDICTCGPQCEEPCDGKDCGCLSCRDSYGALIRAANTMTDISVSDVPDEAPTGREVIKERLYGQDIQTQAPQAVAQSGPNGPKPKKRGRPKKEVPKTAAQLWSEAMGG